MSPTNCPYCNSPVPAGVTHCPRCDERVATGPVAPAGRVGASEPGPPRKTWTRPLAVVAGLGLLGVVAGLAYSRLAPPGDPPPPVAEGPGADEAARPEAWVGLGYLPPDCNAVVAARPAGFREPGWPDFADRVRRALGVAPEQIAEVVVGLRVDSGLIPKWVAVLTSRAALDPARIRALGSPGSLDGRPVVRARAEGDVPAFVAWQAGPRTLILADDPARFAEVPREPAAGIDHLPAVPRERILTRLPDAPLLWAVADTDGWESSLTVGILIGPLLPNVGREDLSRLKSFVLALEVDGDGSPSLSVWLGLDDAATAAELRRTLTDRLDRFPGTRPVIGGGGSELFGRIAGGLPESRDALRRLSEPGTP